MGYKISVLCVGANGLDIDFFKSAAALIPDLEYGGGFNTVAACYDYITKSSKNYLVFMESDLPDGQGLWLTRQLSGTHNGVVLLGTSAGDLDPTLKMHAFDHIIKPVSALAIAQTISSISQKYQMLSSIIDGPQKSLKSPANGKQPSRIFLHMINSIEVIVLDEVLYISSQGNYSRFVKSDGTELLSSKSIKNYEAMLADHSDFIRIHKSYIVNRNYVLSISKKLKSYKVILSNKEELEISYPRKEEILKQIIE